MPSISLVTFAGQTVTPQDDSLVYESALGDGGIIYGAQVTLKNANTLHIASGHGIIAGRKFTVYESDIPIVLSSAGVLLGRLYIHMDLSNASDPIEILTETGNSLSPLVQDEDVNIVNGVFEFNLATFNVSTSTIGDLRNVYPRVQYANSGSFIYVRANNPSLIGQEVQITDGTDTIYAIFDANGVAELRNVFMTGTLQLTATDGTYTAGATLNVPYYGTYNVTMAFWLATLSITTTSPEFYNQQITVKNSSDEVVGTTTFNSVGAASFIVNAPDTYTLSIVSGGNTYTSTVNVTAQTTYDVTLNAGFQWTDWVTSGGLNPSSYGSLADVLVDETALRRLFIVHASVDYMAEISNSDNAVETIINTDLAAKWINLSAYALDTLYANTIIKGYMDTADKYFYGEWVITDDTTTPPTWGAKGNVPVMTSNNAPYGVASASSSYSGYDAYKAFDGTNSAWMPTQGATTAYIQYNFVNPIYPKKVRLHTNTGNESISITFTLKGSNDGFATSKDLGTITVSGQGSIVSELTELENLDYYLSLRLYTANTMFVSNSKNMDIVSLQFYGRELSVSVPKMATNTTPYGEAFANNSSSGGAPYRAFNNESQGWYGSNSPYVVKDLYVGYGFDKLTVLKMATIQLLYSQSVSSFKGKIQASADNTNWVDVSDEFTCASVSGNGTKVILSLLNNSAYNRFRMLVTQTATSANLSGVKLQFYGLDYSEKEFEEGTNKKWLYDHGVELETFTAITSAVGVATKEPSDLYIAKTSTSNGQVGFYSPDIDLTLYSLFRGIVANRLSNIAYPRLYIGNSGQTSLTGSELAMVEIRSKSYNAIDISSFNSNYRVIFGIYTNSTNLADANINELWLE